jgi:predicted anti-sigma-YlaC factor YlaD
MDCPEVRDSLEAYTAGELDVASAGRVRQHLDSCVDCSLYHESLVELVADLRHAGRAVRYLQPFSLPELALPRRRSRSARLVWALAAVSAAWAVLATVLVVAPSVSERLSAFPTGKALHDARAAARADSARSQRLAAANVLLGQKLTAARLGVPLAAVQTAERYLATHGSEAAGVQAQTHLKWTLVGAVMATHQPNSQERVTIMAVTSFASGGEGSTTRMELRIRLERATSGEWTVRQTIP